MNRRRALMNQQDNPSNGLVDGTYGSLTVSNNEVTRGVQSSASYYKGVPLKTPIDVVAGDVITLTFSNSGTAFDRIYVADLAVVNYQKIVANTPYSATYTENRTITSISWQMQPVTTPYSYVVSMQINGVTIF